MLGVVADGFSALAYQPVVNVIIDGETVIFEGQTPVIINNRLLVPVRGVFENLGFDVEWDKASKTAVLTRGGYRVIITVDSTYFKVNGGTYSLDVPAQIINNRVMLPIRFVIESIGYTVTWNASNREAVIMTSYEKPEDNNVFILTIFANETSLRQGSDFAINVKLTNTGAESHEIYYSILFWPFIPGWDAMQGVAIDPPEYQPRQIQAGGVISNVGIWGEEGEPWLLGRDLEPGEHELQFRAAFVLDFGQDTSRRVEVWSNTIVLVVR